MTDPTDNTPEVEDRLRRALASRAASVEPRIAGADPATLAERAAAARRHAARRRMALSAAAVVAVVALAAGAFVLWPDSDDETDVATGGGDTTTTTTEPTGGEPNAAADIIWPLPSMSIVYESAGEAAEAFITGYLALDAECPIESLESAPVKVIQCAAPGNAQSTMVSTRVRPDDTWVVTGATSTAFTAAPTILGDGGSDPALPPPGVAALITPTAGNLPSPLTVELRPRGSLQVTATTGSLQDLTPAAGTTVPLTLADPAEVDGPHVLVVIAGTTASATLFDAADLQPAPTTTTTTEPATDDGVPGWPGPTARVFDDPEAAARAFVDEVLQFADPALGDATGDNTDMIFEYHPRPTASISTAITVHNTGNVRGWVVTGLQGSAGTIDSVTVDGTTVTVTGSAQAFEATVSILVLDQTGAILGESFTMAGSSEVLPYQGTVEFDPGLGEPFWVMIAEGDASGDGLLTWATTENL